MKVACIGWGSLVWNPDKLKIYGSWFNNGPMLPIEFSRISLDGRVTLIIDKEALLVQTFWAPMSCDLDEAKESLKEREKTINSMIHFTTNDSNETDKIKLIVQDWLKNSEMDAAIWTGLSYSVKTNKQRPTIDTIISHIANLDMVSRVRAVEYIKNTPKQIDTEYRRKINNFLAL